MFLRVAFLCLVGLLAPIMSSPALAEIYLAANFDDHPIDAQIGIGGPEVGEPIAVSSQVIATVRNTPMATPCLQLTDNDDYAAGSAKFEFIGSQEISNGVVSIVFDLWFPEQQGFSVGVREQGGATMSFLSLDFAEDGYVRCGDENSYYSTGVIYPLGQLCHVAIRFDMDAGTYCIYLDGVQVVQDRAHGVVGGGIGRVFFSCMHDEEMGSSFYVDNILVSDTFVPVNGVTWGQVKTLFGDESH